MIYWWAVEPARIAEELAQRLREVAPPGIYVGVDGDDPARCGTGHPRPPGRLVTL